MIYELVIIYGHVNLTIYYDLLIFYGDVKLTTYYDVLIFMVRMNTRKMGRLGFIHM